jgi:hypothetical protein
LLATEGVDGLPPVAGAGSAAVSTVAGDLKD